MIILNQHDIELLESFRNKTTQTRSRYLGKRVRWSKTSSRIRNNIKGNYAGKVIEVRADRIGRKIYVIKRRRKNIQFVRRNDIRLA